MIESGISKTTILTSSLTLKNHGIGVKQALAVCGFAAQPSQVIQTATGNFCFGETGGRNSRRRGIAAAIATQDIQPGGDRFF